MTVPFDASRRNPFNTRRVRPGAIEYLFPPGCSARQLVDQLAAEQWWGEIVGPHGCGKSTLLHSLLPLLKEAGRNTEWVTLEQGQWRFPSDAVKERTWNSNTQLLVDGYQQLGWPARWSLRSKCRRFGVGLLVTTHRSVGLPLLLRIEPQLATAQAVVEQLLRENSQGDSQQVISPQDVRQCFDQHRGNIREALFALYDLYQQRQL